jgi:two-component system sensor histidine kinase YesM
LAENAFMHGIKHIRDNGVIQVKAFKEDDEIVISLTDNGVGAPLEHLQLQLIESRRTSYGLFNVQQRLQLNYGKEYGLSFAVPLNGTGLRVMIRIPAIEKKEAHDV